MTDFGTVDGGVPLPDSMAETEILTDLAPLELTYEQVALALPEGFEWDARWWDDSMRCVNCGVHLTVTAPTVAMMQQRFDEMAVEHRRRCPGDGA